MTNRCESCGHDAFQQTGAITRCSKCRAVTRADQVQCNDHESSILEKELSPQLSLPTDTYEHQETGAAQGTDRVLDSTQRDTTMVIDRIKQHAIQALISFFADERTTHHTPMTNQWRPPVRVSKPLRMPNDTREKRPTSPLPYYGTGMVLEDPVDIRLEYGDTRWEIQVLIMQSPIGASEQNPALLNSIGGLRLARECKPSVGEEAPRYGSHTTIIFAIDDIIPLALNDLIMHFYETYAAKTKGATYSTTFHNRLMALRQTLKQTLLVVPPLQPRTTAPPNSRRPQSSPSAYPYRMHSREQWLAYAETMKMHDLEATSLDAYKSFCQLYRLIPMDTDFLRARLYIELYDRLLNMDYSRYRQANPSNTTSQIVAEINSIRRIKYTKSTTPTSASWIWGLLGRKISQANDVPSLHGSCLLTVPTRWTLAKVKAVEGVFAQGIPNSPMKASLLAYLLTMELEPSGIDRYYTQLHEAQRASIIVFSVVAFLEEKDTYRLYKALAADTPPREIFQTDICPSTYQSYRQPSSDQRHRSSRDY